MILQTKNTSYIFFLENGYVELILEWSHDWEHEIACISLEIVKFLFDLMWKPMISMHNSHTFGDKVLK